MFLKLSALSENWQVCWESGLKAPSCLLPSFFTPRSSALPSPNTVPSFQGFCFLLITFKRVFGSREEGSTALEGLQT